MKKTRVSIVSYTNALPFLQGIEDSGLEEVIELSQDHPAKCAEKLLLDKVDIGLVPIYSVLSLPHPYILSNYCISAQKQVRTVSLFSELPVEKINTVYLDYQSMTSIRLIKILMEEYWKKNVVWKETSPGFEDRVIKGDSGAVIIGDRNFIYEKRYRYKYDLAEAWQSLTGLPMVFACWVANKKQDTLFLKKFNQALEDGIGNIKTAAKKSSLSLPVNEKELTYYLNNNIDYILDHEKKQSIRLFLQKCCSFQKELSYVSSTI